jgi:hypothetical protein
VKIFYVKTHVSCLLHANHAVPVEFCGIQVGHTDGGITSIIDQISSRPDLDSVGIIFLRAIIDKQICIREKILGRESMLDLVMRHYEHCVSTFLSSIVATLCHAPNIFFKSRLLHFGCGRVVHQFLVTGDNVAGDGVHHGVGIMFNVKRYLINCPISI